MNVVNMMVKDLIPYEKNPRFNDEAVKYVANSIKEFGFKVPIIVDKNNVIVAGHTRYKACKELGIKNVPVIIADDLNEEQIKAFRLADNKVSEKAEWNFELLQEELEDLDINMSDFGFDIDLDIDEEQEIIEDEVPEVPEEPKAKLGDIYQLGNHRLMCGDSTNEEDVKKLMNGKLADLVLTDPPYNVAIENSQGMKIKNDNMGDSEFLNFLTKAFACLNLALKEGGVFYVWFASREHINFETALNNNSLEVRQELIWNKSSLIIGRQDYQWKHEPCLYGWKEGAGHYFGGDRKQTTVIDWDKPSKCDLHPTMKPVGLFDYQIKNSSRKNEIVLDLFGGSGTTIIACEQNGRNAYVMEYDPKYVDVIITRWENLTGKKAVLLND